MEGCLKMVLLTHTGKESTLRATDENQKYGNPQLFHKALSLGVTVVMAHSGRDGSNINQYGKQESNFNLFLKMMEEPKYKNCLFGELSALTLRDQNTLDHLGRVMETPELLGRMVNGSDYPLQQLIFSIRPAFWSQKNISPDRRKEPWMKSILSIRYCSTLF